MMKAASVTTKEYGRGTGLGLSTVAGIVRSHSGFVNVYSEIDRGTRFKVYLPAIESAQSAPAKPSQRDLPVGAGELILVIDDENAIREITRETLSAFGYHVIIASDGAEAMAVFAAHKNEVKVVITDMMMPYMDGPATIRALRRLDPKVKIIATSGLKAEDKIADVSCRSNEGRLVWKRRIAGRPGGSTASITNDSAILITSETGRLSAFNAAGDVLWGSNSDWLAVTSPVTARDGAVILGARKHNEPSGQPDRLMALDRWGNKMWELTIQGEVSEAPVIGAESAIYFGTHKGYFYSVTPEGGIKRHCRLGARIASAPAITGAGLVLIGAYDGCLYAFSPEMEVTWQFQTEAMIHQCSPVIAVDGTTYL